MLYRVIIFVLVIFLLPSNYIFSNNHVLKKNVPFYLSNEFNYNDPAIRNRPIFGRVKHTYVPPEILKHKPEQTRILNESGFELINISPGNNAQSETWIAINPRNPENIIATSNDNMYMTGDYRMSSWASTDGGKTWKHSTTPPNKGLLINQLQGGSMTIFDPGIAFDSEGNAYYSYGFCQINNNNAKPDDNGVFLAKSTDGGLSWKGTFNGDPISVVAAEIGNVPNQPFHDRFSIAIDNNPKSPFKDYIYVSWMKFHGQNSQIVCAVSTDKGLSWSLPINLYPSSNVQSPVPAVGPDGEVYVIWQERNRENHTTKGLLKRSDNGGKTWTNVINAIEVATIGEIDPDVNISRYILKNKQNIRVSSYPAIAVDCTPPGSPTRGRVYVVMAGREAPGGEYGIYLTYSTNKGQTWAPKKRIDDAKLRNDMFFPAIAIDNTNGMIAILYYSSQNDPNNVGVDAYLAVSRDNGETFKNIRLTPQSIYLNSPSTVSQQDVMGSNIYWGDYTSIAANNGKIYPLWWWPTSPSYHYGSLDLFTALVSTNPKPPIDFKVVSKIENNNVKVKLSWINPTEDLLGGILENYKTEIYRNEVLLTKLEKGINEYYDTDVIDGTPYTYKIRTVLENGQASIYQERSIFAGGAAKANPPTDVLAKPHPNGILVEWTNPTTSIDSSDVRDLTKVKIYLNNELKAIVDNSIISAGQRSSYIINHPLKTFAKVKLVAVTNRNNVEVESDPSEEVFSYSGALIDNYSDNFDNETLRIPHFRIFGDWGATSQTAASKPYSLNQTPNKNYAPNANYRLLFAPFVVTENRKSLNFNYICKIHTTDFGHIFISRDFCKSFIEIMRFNENSHPDQHKKSTLEECSFVNVSYDLSPYIGDTLYLAIGLTTSPFREDLGLFIDDLIIDDRVSVTDREHPIYKSLECIISPNPVSLSAKLKIIIPISGNFNASVYDQIGRKITTIDNRYINAGVYDYHIDLSNYLSGMYYININLNNYSKTIPIIKN